MGKKWLGVLRVMVSAGALAFLFWKIGLGETLAVLLRARPAYLLAAFLLYVVSLMVRAYRWFVLIEGLGAGDGVSFGRLLRLYFVGQFFSSFLPSQFGGDVVRALELTQDTESPAAVGTVLLDRMSGLLVLFAMGLLVLPFNVGRMDAWLVWLLVAVAGGGLLVGGLVLEGRTLRRLTRWLPSVLALEGEGAMARVYAAVTGCGWRAVTRAFGVSLLFNVLNVVINYLCGRAVGADVGLGYFFVVTPLLSVSGLIPSIGGWGVRETVSTAVFAPVGIGPNTAAALGMALGGITLTAGLLGGGLYLVEGIQKARGEKPAAGRR